MVRTTVVGSYPRVSAAADGQRLRRAVGRWERGALSREGLRAVEIDVIAEVVREQVELGVDLPTDGQVTWYDSQSHFASKLEGMGVGALERYFDTNTYYRRPLAKGRVRWTSPITVDDWTVASAATSVPVKGVLTGPYTLAALSASRPTPDLLWDLAVALGHEVSALAHAGCTRLQIDEPAFTRLETLPKGYDRMVDALLEGRGRMETTLFTYFGGVAPILEDLLNYPFDVLGLDLVQGAGTLGALGKVNGDKPLVLGLLDARNTRMEDPKALAQQVLAIGDWIPLEKSYLSPSNGLEFLPRDTARAKLQVLSSAAELVREAFA